MSKSDQPDRRFPLPAALQPQAFGEVAAKIVLSEMLLLARRIDPDLAADVDPAAAEGVILRQIAVGILIGHAVEKQPVQMGPLMARRLRHLHKTVGVGMGADPLGTMTTFLSRPTPVENNLV